MTTTAEPRTTEHDYATRGRAALRAIVHAPPDATDARPAIVLFHGGGWRTANVAQFAPQCDALARRGMVAIRCGYRVLDVHGATPLDAIADARAAMRWARANAAMLGIDAARLAAGGGSAGGHLAACCALLGDDFDAPGDPIDRPCAPAALALFNPVLDTSVATGFMPQRFGDRADAASPLGAVRPGALPPTLIQHGTDDEAVPIATARAFARRARDCGARCELIEYAGARHGFFNPPPLGDAGHHDATLAATVAFLESLGFLEPAEARS